MSASKESGRETGTREFLLRRAPSDVARRALEKVRAVWHGSVVRDVVWPFAVSRAALLLVTVIALAVVTPSATPGAWSIPGHPLLSAWARWDAGWYLDVAQRGYEFAGGQQSNVAFAPAYPLLMRALGSLLGGTDRATLALAGVVISNAALIGAMVLLHRLVLLDYDRATASRAVLYVLIYPASFYLSIVYPESLFAAAVIGSFYFARTQRWALSGLLGGLAAATRPHGVILIVPLLFEYLLQRRWRLRAVGASVLALGLIPLAFGAWMIYLYRLTGIPTALIVSQSAWGREIVTPPEAFLDYLSRPLQVHGESSLIDLASALLILVLAVISWRMVRSSYAFLVSIFLLGILSTGSPNAMLRLSLPLFPLFVVLGIWGRRSWFDRAFMVMGASLSALFMAIFALWYRVF